MLPPLILLCPENLLGLCLCFWVDLIMSMYECDTCCITFGFMAETDFCPADLTKVVDVAYADLGTIVFFLV